MYFVIFLPFFSRNSLEFQYFKMKKKDFENSFQNIQKFTLGKYDLMYKRLYRLILELCYGDHLPTF